MKEEAIASLLKIGELRIKPVDKERVKSAIVFAESNAKVAKSFPLTEESATIVFSAMYESVRQLGMAKWWLLGYDPSSHVTALDILKEMNIKDKVKLNYLDRFKKIRNDAHYRVIRVTLSQAKELIDFWDTSGKQILEILKMAVR
jgi:hypothetical protein